MRIVTFNVQNLRLRHPMGHPRFDGARDGDALKDSGLQADALDLADRRLVVRTRPADNRRTVRVGITSKGTALLRSIARPLRQCHQRQLGHMSGRELRRLGSLLRSARRPHEPEHSSWR